MSNQPIGTSTGTQSPSTIPQTLEKDTGKLEQHEVQTTEQKDQPQQPKATKTKKAKDDAPTQPLIQKIIQTAPTEMMPQAFGLHGFFENLEKNIKTLTQTVQELKEGLEKLFNRVETMDNEKFSKLEATVKKHKEDINKLSHESENCRTTYLAQAETIENIQKALQELTTKNPAQPLEVTEGQPAEPKSPDSTEKAFSFKAWFSSFVIEELPDILRKFAIMAITSTAFSYLYTMNILSAPILITGTFFTLVVTHALHEASEQKNNKLVNVLINLAIASITFFSIFELRAPNFRGELSSQLNGVLPFSK